MVKKLLKHEFTYYIRIFGLFIPILLAIGVMTRVFLFFDNGNPINQLLISSSVLMLVLGCIALMVLSTVVIILRFYKNMYSAEGYLTFALPVSNSAHIFVKLFTALVCQAACMLSVLLSALIALSGENLISTFHLLFCWVEEIFLEIGAFQSIAFMIEIPLAILASAISTILLYYTCITIGQTAKKNRVLLAVGAYFIYYSASQTVLTILMIMLTVFASSAMFATFFNWLAANPIPALHLLFSSMIAIYGGLSALFWFVTRKIMNKKLNLE